GTSVRPSTTQAQCFRLAMSIPTTTVGSPRTRANFLARCFNCIAFRDLLLRVVITFHTLPYQEAFTFLNAVLHHYRTALLTSAGSAGPPDPGYQRCWRSRQTSPGKDADLRPAPAPSTAPPFGSLGFCCGSPAHPSGTASYEVRVPRVVALPPASSRFRLATDTLAFG